MGVSKSELFSETDNQLANWARVLANPARVAILRHIASQQACICNDLVEELHLAQPTISQHLKELKQAGLIKGNVEGNSVCYCIDTDAIGQIRKALDSFLGCCSEGTCC
jgi:ArsR family transcriptional regulator, arsenate/arsenite/antimonite-responsive transcriptional repressor